MRHHRRNGEKGFVLPLAVLLVLTLGISGAAFMQLDFLERRMGMNEVDNHGSFYLANAGIERARETFKIPEPDLNWTRVLNGTYDGPDPDLLPDYPSDPSPVFGPLELCGPDPSSGCVIPSFGALVDSTSISPLPFDGAFDDGQYEVRAFNNEPGTVDTDQKLIFRARGTVLGEQKLLELTVQAVSGLDLINCQGGSGQSCPEVVNGNPPLDPVDGREPSAHSQLPSLTDQLGSDNFYRFDLHPNNFTKYSPGPALIPNYCAPVGSIDCSNPNKIQIDLDIAKDNNFYFVDTPNAKINIKSKEDRSRVVIYALGGAGGDVIMEGNHKYTDMIIIGQGEIELRDGETHAPLPMPAVIAEGNVTSGSASVSVFGTIYATKTPIPDGLVNVNPVQVHGVVIGDRVQVQGSSRYTDDHQTDPNYLKYYVIMPGFTYPPELKTTVSEGSGSWKEIE